MINNTVHELEIAFEHVSCRLDGFSKVIAGTVVDPDKARFGCTPVQFLSFSYSFQQNVCQIIG